MHPEEFNSLLHTISETSINHYGIYGTGKLSEASPEQWQIFIARISQYKRSFIRVSLVGNDLYKLNDAQWDELLNVLADCDNAEELLLGHNNLFELLPVGILQKLCNLFTRLPKLNSLELNHNFLNQASRVKMQILGNALNQCSLESLDLGGNKLAEIDKDLLLELCTLLSKNKKNIRLEISNNDLFQMSEDKWHVLGTILIKCEDIVLSDNNLAAITEVQGQAIGTILAQCKHLNYLSFNEQNLSAISQVQWQYLGLALAKVATPFTIEWENADFNVLNESQWRWFSDATAAKHLQNLVMLFVSLTGVSESMWEYFGNSIARCENLCKIKIDTGNDSLFAQTEGQWRGFCKALTNNKNTRQIRIDSYNILAIPAAKWQILGNALAGCGKLQSLSFSYGSGDITINNTPEQWQEFWSAITKCQSLQKVSLTLNQVLRISATKWQVLDCALAKAPNLRVIELYDSNSNDVSELQLHAFGTAMAQLKSTTQFKLSLPGCGFSAEKLQLLGEALAQWKNLTGLCLPLYYRLQQTTFHAWCNIVAHCIQLQHVGVLGIFEAAYTPTANDLELLSKTLKQSAALRSVDLRYEFPRDGTLATILQSLPDQVTTILIEKRDILPFMKNDNDQLPYIIEYDEEEDAAKIGCNDDPEFRLGVMQFLYKLTQSRIRNRQEHIGLGFLKERGFYESFGPYLTYHDMKRMQPPVVAADANKASASIKLA